MYMDMVVENCRNETNYVMSSGPGDSSLYLACREGDLFRVKILLSYPNPVVYRIYTYRNHVNDNTIFHAACISGNVDVIKCIMNHPLFVNISHTVNISSQTVFFYARTPEVFDLLISNEHVHNLVYFLDDKDFNVLCWYIEYSYYDLVRHVLKKQVSEYLLSQTQSRYKYNILHCSCSNPDIFQDFLDCKWLGNSIFGLCERNEENILHEICFSGVLECLEIFLNYFKKSHNIHYKKKLYSMFFQKNKFGKIPINVAWVSDEIMFKLLCDTPYRLTDLHKSKLHKTNVQTYVTYILKQKFKPENHFRLHDIDVCMDKVIYNSRIVLFLMSLQNSRVDIDDSFELFDYLIERK